MKTEKPKFGLSVNRGSISNVIFFASLSRLYDSFKNRILCKLSCVGRSLLDGHKVFGNHLAPHIAWPKKGKISAIIIIIIRNCSWKIRILKLMRNRFK